MRTASRNKLAWRPRTVCAAGLLPLLLLALPFAVQAEFSYTTINDSVTITRYYGSDGSVTIPSTINNHPVTGIADFAFALGTELTGVSIPKTVTHIGVLPFYGCTHLSAIIVDGDNPAFSSVAGILFDASQTTLIECPPGQPGSYAIPNTVASIGDGAFYGCASLTAITIPDSVVSIGRSAFFGCASLPSITIPSSVTSFPPVAFQRCTSLTTITVDDANPVLSSVDGVLFDKTEKTLIEYPAGKTGCYTVSNNVTSIGGYAFMYCDGLTDVAIGDGVTNIEGQAFYNCGSLTRVTILKSSVRIGPSAFAHCTSLAEVTMGDGVTSVGNSAFAYCSSLLNVSMGHGVTDIAASAFSYCTGLTNVTIGDSVTNIGSSAFYNCSSVISVTMPSSLENIGDSAFSWCGNAAGFYFKGKAPSCGSLAFQGNPGAMAYYLPETTGWETTFAGLPTALWIPELPYICTVNEGTINIHKYTGSDLVVSIPDEIVGLPVTSIGDDAFYHCTTLTSITIPDGVTGIGAEAFDGCASMTSLTIGKSVASVGDFAFRNCGLTSVKVPNGVTNLGTGAFEFCGSLTSALFGEGITSISGYAFNGCSSLSNITIPNTVTAIGDYAFYDCASLVEVTIPASVTGLGDFAFYACSSLTEVYFLGNAPTVGWAVFYVDNNPTLYYLPGTTWEVSLGDMPTAPWLPQMQTCGDSLGVRTNQFGFNIRWASGQTVVVEACTDLANPTWCAVGTNTLAGESSYFNDPEWTNHPARFYRLRSP